MVVNDSSQECVCSAQQEHATHPQYFSHSLDFTYVFLLFLFFGKITPAGTTSVAESGMLRIKGEEDRTVE